MVSKSQQRWKTAQKAEKNAFDVSSIRSSDSVNSFFKKYFSLTDDYFVNKTVLEIGCSPAATIHGVNSSCLNVGVDPLAGQWSGLYNKTTSHIQAIGEFLPLRSKFFDAVLCINALDHVRVPAEVLKEMHRSLSEDGTLFLWVQTFSTLKIVRKFLGLIDTPHPHHFNDKEVLCLLSNMGYNVIFHQCSKASIHSAFGVIKTGKFLSGLKSLLANLLLGLHESSFLCTIKIA